MPYYIKTEKFKTQALSLPESKRKKYINAHKKWILELKEQGINISSGYLVNENKRPGGGGLLILNSDSYEKAKSLILKDPMIINNLVTWELQEWVKIID